jgi:hypothetical protein
LKPKIPVWVNFRGLETENVGSFYGHLEYFTSMWYILLPFENLVVILVYLFPVLVYCITENLAALTATETF